VISLVLVFVKKIKKMALSAFRDVMSSYKKVVSVFEKKNSEKVTVLVFHGLVMSDNASCC